MSLTHTKCQYLLYLQLIVEVLIELTHTNSSFIENISWVWSGGEQNITFKVQNKQFLRKVHVCF